MLFIGRVEFRFCILLPDNSARSATEAIDALQEQAARFRERSSLARLRLSRSRMLLMAGVALEHLCMMTAVANVFRLILYRFRFVHAVAFRAFNIIVLGYPVAQMGVA